MRAKKGKIKDEVYRDNFVFAVPIVMSNHLKKRLNFDFQEIPVGFHTI